MLVGEGQPVQALDETSSVEAPERDLDKQTPNFGQNARTLAGNIH